MTEKSQGKGGRKEKGTANICNNMFLTRGTGLKSLSGGTRIALFSCLKAADLGAKTEKRSELVST